MALRAVTIALGLVLFLAGCGGPAAATETVAPPTPTLQVTTAFTVTNTPESTEEACTVAEARTVTSSPGGTESVAAAEDGSIYTSELCSGKVFRIDPDGNRSTVATIPYGVDNSLCDVAATLGIAVSDGGDTWVVVDSSVPESNGVWHVRPDGSKDLEFPMSPEAAGIPNDLAFDPEGVLYITESEGGAIWKATPGGVAELWLQTDLLVPPEGSFYGANGIAIQDDAIYATNFGSGTVVKVPVGEDGSPGEPVVIATDLRGPDALDFDVLGDLHAVLASAIQLVRIPPSGDPEIVLNLRPFGATYPTGLAFAGAPSAATTLYVANLNFAENKGSVLQVDLCGVD